MEMKEAMEILNNCKENGTLKEDKKIGQTMRSTTYLLDGWEYTFFCDKNEIKKVEAYNHRELIEKWVK